MKAFVTTILTAFVLFQFFTIGCSKKHLIQGKPVASWVSAVKIGGFDKDPAIDVLISAGSQAMPDLTQLLLEDKSWKIQDNAAYAISAIGYRNPDLPEVHNAIPALVTAAQNTNGEVRIYSVQALGAIGLSASNAIPVLIQLTKDVNQSVRMCVVESLGRIHATSPESVAALKVAMSDASSDVRITAKQALEIVQENHK